MKRLSMMLLVALMALASWGQTPNVGVKPAPVDLTIEQGQTWGAQLQFKDGAGAVINLTGYTVTAQVRASYKSSTILATLTCTVTDAVNGVITLSLTSTQADALTAPATAQWDLFLTDSALPPNTIRIMAGTVSIVPRVTR